MAYRNNASVAYDLSAYDLQKSAPELKVVGRKHHKATALLSVRAIFSFAIVVTMVSLIVYNQVQLNEVSGTINELNKQISEAENKNVEMMSKLESTLSLHAISEKAKSELGMNRLNQYQTVYIRMEREDYIELTEHSPSQSITQQVHTALTDAISHIQEYIGKQ